MKKIKEFFKRILPPPVKSFMREINGLRQLIVRMGEKVNVQQLRQEELTKALSEQQLRQEELTKALSEQQLRQEELTKALSEQQLRQEELVKVLLEQQLHQSKQIEVQQKTIEVMSQKLEKQLEEHRKEIGGLAKRLEDIYKSQQDTGKNLDEVFKKLTNISEQNKKLVDAIPKPVKRDYDYYRKLPSSRYEEELELWFKERTGKMLNLEFPETFNEKIQWLKLYDSTPLKTKLADKYLVRDWIKEKIGEQYLIPLLGVWDSFDEIDFDSLPDQFALKANHGSGWNYVIKDKSTFDRAEAKKNFDTWMSQNFAFKAGLELHYMNIPPKIIAEEYHDCQYEYQFWCFNGIPQFISAIHEPHGQNKKATYDLEWSRLDFVTSLPKMEENLEKPCLLKEMNNIAEKLCKDFAVVRVDFLHNGRQFFVGELTFTPATGLCKWNPPSQDLVCGEMIHLPDKSPMPKRMR